MKISTMLQSNAVSVEEKKRALQRKEMGDAYKRTTKFVEASKNPLLAALENLISGKTERELMEADQAAGSFTLGENLEQPEVKKEIQSLQRIEDDVITHEHAHQAAGPGVTENSTYTYTKEPDDQQYAVSGEVPIQTKTAFTHEETINILELVQKAALAPAQPSAQDLRVAASAAAQIQQTRNDILNGETIEESEPYAEESLEVNIPERFQQEVERDASKPTFFGQNIEERMYALKFNRATSKYASHIAMVKNGYMPYIEPKFSQIA